MMNLTNDQKQDIKGIFESLLIILACASLVLFSYWISNANLRGIFKTQQEFHGPIEISETA